MAPFHFSHSDLQQSLTIFSHAYACTKMVKMPCGEKLIQMHNPWGRGDWQGAWSDSSQKWQKYEEYRPTESDDGNFWIDTISFKTPFMAAHLAFNQDDWKIIDDIHGSWSASAGTAGGHYSGMGMLRSRSSCSKNVKTYVSSNFETFAWNFQRLRVQIDFKM